jgi:hypothetical protein
VKTIDTWRRLLVLLSGLLLAGCGDGLTTVADGVGIGGTGITMGTVTGFGSLVIEGDTYSSATAEYLEGNDKDEAVPVSSLSVALGQQVQMLTDDQGNPTTVLVEPTLIGTASNVSGSGMTVNGVTVRVNTSLAAGPRTYYAGVSGMNAVEPGMKVEVHGLYGVDANGPYVQATRIAQLPAASTVTRVTGQVTDLNPAAGTFRLGSMTIHYDPSTSLMPKGITLANGQLVNVWSPDAPIADQLTAVVVRVRSLQGISGQIVVSGLVTALGVNQFTVSGIVVDDSDPSLATVVQTLKQGDYVVVSGQADASTGRLVAASIATTSNLSSGVELKGTVTDYVNSANFLVRGVIVDASAATIGGGALADGAYVEVHGHVQGNVVIATSVEVHAVTPDDATVEYDGIVSALVGDSFVLTLPDDTAYNVTLADNIGYENGTASQLINGARVVVEATHTSTGLIVYAIEFKDLGEPSDEQVYETSGIAYDITATSFRVNDLTIQINGVDVTGLDDGVKVEVHFISSGGLYLAQEISVDD